MTLNVPGHGPKPERFLCDEILAKLAHWLRAAGYDVAMAEPGTRDDSLMVKAVATGRLLLTRDREFIERRGAADHVFLIQSDDLDEQVAEITEPLQIDWMKAPFTRCLMDNADLRPATGEEIRTLPQKPEDLGQPVMTCPVCGRHYWRGSHTERMIERMKKWRC